MKPEDIGNVLVIIGRTLTAINYPRDSVEYAVRNVLLQAIKTGAEELHRLAPDPEPMELDGWQTVSGRYIKFEPGSYIEIMLQNGNCYVYPHEIVDWRNEDIKAWRFV